MSDDKPQASLNVQAWSETDMAQLRKLRAEGMSLEAIGTIVRRSKGAVGRKCKDLGLTEPPRGVPKPVEEPKPKAVKPGPKPQPEKPKQAQPLRPGAITLPILPSLHEPLRGYIAVMPNGVAILATLRPTPDDAWQALRDQTEAPDALAGQGWHVCRVLVTLERRVELVQVQELEPV